MLTLIASDDQNNIELVLEALGGVDNTIECISSENGDEALRLLKFKKMPRLKWKTFLAELKSNSALSAISVVILTTSKLKTRRRQKGLALSISLLNLQYSLS